MKIQVKKVFKYTFDSVTTHTLTPGFYDVPAEVDKEAANLAISFGAAVRVIEKPAEKKAPENKVVSAPKTKAKRAKKAK